MDNAEIDNYLGFLENTVEQEHKEAVEAIKVSLEQVKMIMERLLTLGVKELAQENEMILDELVKKLQSNFDKLEPPAYKERQSLENVTRYLSLVIQLIKGLNEKTSQIKDMSYIRKTIDETIARVYFHLIDILDKRREHYEQNTDLAQKEPGYYKKLGGWLSSVGEKSASVRSGEIEQFLKHIINDVLKGIRKLQQKPSFLPITKV